MPDHRKRVRKRQAIRLDPAAYAAPGTVYSITIAVQDRRPVFADPTAAAGAVDALTAHARRTGVSVLAYCIMPDHVHLVISPSETCDVVTFVGQYKNLAQRAAWQAGVEGAFWQKRFWDHFLRKEESLDRVVEYVLNNPVRRNLAEDWRAYPFAGSLVFEL